MKKWLIGLSILIVLILSCIFLFVPDKLNISVAVSIDCTARGASRSILDETKWEKWWPEKGTNKYNKIHIYKNQKFQIQSKLLNGVDVLIINGDSELNSTITIFQTNLDSSILEWHCTVRSGLNPWRRILQYRQAMILKTNMATILGNLSSFLEKKENIYGIFISKSSVTDSILVATKSIFAAYPSIKEVYELINHLESYISKQGAKQSGSPMMNITKLSMSQFKVMVAVPTNKKLISDSNIFPIKMVDGNYLVATVHGGLNSVDEAMNELLLYFQDYQKTAMAIPFQSLLTDRIKEPDTAKWITKIYAPILK